MGNIASVVPSVAAIAHPAIRATELPFQALALLSHSVGSIRIQSMIYVLSDSLIFPLTMCKFKEDFAFSLVLNIFMFVSMFSDGSL